MIEQISFTTQIIYFRPRFFNLSLALLELDLDRTGMSIFFFSLSQFFLELSHKHEIIILQDLDVTGKGINFCNLFFALRGH